MPGERAHPPDPLASSIVRILDDAGEPVGAGFFIEQTHIATCAHVVSAVLGGSPRQPNPPSGAVAVELALLDDHHVGSARVAQWLPINPSNGTGDVAILEVHGPLTSHARPAPMYRPDRPWGHRFRVVGFPLAMQDGVWTSGELRGHQGTRWVQLQGDPRTQPIASGFSGGPVWSDAVNAVVGMTVATDANPGTTTAYSIPIDRVLGVDPGLLPNPYRGLESFGEEHADVFCGRDADVERLAETIAKRPFVAVLGASGTGKSSLVGAGLVPRLRRAGLHVAMFRPSLSMAPRLALATVLVDLAPPQDDEDVAGAARRLDTMLADADSLPDVAERVAASADGCGVLIVADQFEELAAGDEDRGAGTDLLATLVELARVAPRLADGQSSIRVVLTLRWESMSELLTGGLADAFDDATVAIGPMTRSQLREAILGPAARAPGLSFEEGLVERILDDAVAEPGQLPLVESLLATLWQRRDGGRITMADYDAIGGVQGALREHAEAAIAQIGDDTATGSVRRLLTALTQPTEASEHIRRVVRLDELSPADRHLADALAHHRIVVVGRDAAGNGTAELAHQALIDHWPRLRSWLDDDLDFLMWLRRTEQQVDLWAHAGRADDALLRSSTLAVAEEWIDERGDDASPSVRAFVASSAARQRLDRRRRRAVLSVLGIAAVIALVLGSLFAYQRRLTGREEARSASRALAALSADSADSDPAQSILLALAAYRTALTAEAEEVMFRRYVEHRRSDTVLSGARGEIRDVAASADGSVVVTVSTVGLVTLWTRSDDGTLATEHLEGVRPLAVDLAPDGSSILLVEEQRLASYDVAGGQIGWEIPVAWEEIGGYAVGDDGVVVVLRTADDGSPWLQLWEPADDGARLAAERVLPAYGPGEILGIDHDQNAVVFVAQHPSSVDLTVSLWDVASASVQMVGRAGRPAWLTEDGAVASCDGSGASLQLLDTRTGEQSGTVTLPGDTSCADLTVDARGDLAVSADVAVDVRTGGAVAQALPAGCCQAVVYDGDRPLAVSHDGTRVVFTAVASSPPWTPAGSWLAGDGDHVVGVSENGRRLAVATTTGSISVVATAHRPAPYLQLGRHGLTVDRDGMLVADQVADDRIQVRRLPSLDLVSEVQRPDIDGEVGVWFHGDRLMTSAGARAQWWDPATGAQVADLDLTEADVDIEAGDVVSVTPHPDGERVVVIEAGQPTIHLVAFEAAAAVDTIDVGAALLGAQFDLDGSHVIVLRPGGQFEMWDVESERRVLGSVGPLRADADSFIARFLREPGHYFFGDGPRLRWYEAGSEASVRSLDLGGSRAAVDVSSDGLTLLYRDSREMASPVIDVAELQADAWATHLCGVLAGRDLTSEELARLPDAVDEQAMCP